MYPRPTDGPSTPNTTSASRVELRTGKRDDKFTFGNPRVLEDFSRLRPELPFDLIQEHIIKCDSESAKPRHDSRMREQIPKLSERLSSARARHLTCDKSRNLPHESLAGFTRLETNEQMQVVSYVSYFMELDVRTPSGRFDHFAYRDLVIAEIEATLRFRRTHRNVQRSARIDRTNDLSLTDRELSTVRETARVKDSVILEKVALFSFRHWAMLFHTL